MVPGGNTLGHNHIVKLPLSQDTTKGYPIVYSIISSHSSPVQTRGSVMPQVLGMQENPERSGTERNGTGSSN